MEKAEKSGKPTPVWQLTGERREVVARPDGLLEQNLTTAPARTWRSGGWVDVDTDLRRADDGSVAPVATTVGLRFSGGGKGPFVRMIRAGREFSLGIPGDLPEPRLEADSATYVDVPFKGVDLQVRALEDGFSHSFVVRNAQAAADPRLARLQLQMGGGLAVGSDGRGGLKVKDPGSGGVMFEAPQPQMWDATLTEPTEGSVARVKPTERVRKELEKAPGPASKVRPLAATVTGKTLNLVPDRTLLTDRSVTFPVVIDPAWRTPLSTAAVMVNTDYATDTSWADEGMGICKNGDPHMSNCGGDGTVTKRLFYTFKPAGWKDQAVIAAEFEVNEVWAYNCTASEMQVWRTKQPSGATTWGQQAGTNFAGFWQQKLAYKSVAHGNEGIGCNDHTVEFRSTELREYVESLNTVDSPTLTFGLKAADEGSVTGWKRFSNKAALRLVINVRPTQPGLGGMRMSNGTSVNGICQPANDPLIVTGYPAKLQAEITDPNVGEKLQGEAVLAWDDGTGWRDQVTNITSDVRNESDDVDNPTTYTFAMSSSTHHIFIPENKLVSWRARGWDFKKNQDTGQDTNEWQSASLWSNASDLDSPGGVRHACHFIIDTARPPAPKVTSADGRYPQKPPNLGWYGAAGVAGKFDIRAGSTAAADKPTSYRIHLSGWTSPREVPADANGNLLGYSITPDSSGEKMLKVEAKDQANRTSAQAIYEFRVNHTTPYEGYWRLDEQGGSSAVNEMDTGLHNLQLKGTDYTWKTPAKIGTGLTVNVDSDSATRGYAETSQRVVDPTQSFTVAAWVKLDKKTWYSTAVGQDGEVNSSFYLTYNHGKDRWALTNRGEVAQALSAQPPQIGKWTHLVGVYDAASKQYKLYVNGVHEGTSGTVPAWNGGDGPLTVGRGKTEGSPVDFFPGTIDDVRVQRKAVTLAEAQRLFYGTVAARWKLDANANGSTLDDTGIGLVLKNRATTATAARCGEKVIDGGCLVLGDPSETQVVGDDHAVTTGPIIRSDQSFSVAGHVMLSSFPTGRETLFSQAGTNTNAFTVRFNRQASGGNGAWEIDVPDSDAAGVVRRTVQHESCRVCNEENAPDHVALVYEAPRRTLSLYVNGLLSAQLESTRDDVSIFRANGAFGIGAMVQGGVASEFLRGTVDDVWVYQGDLKDGQIIELAAGQSGLTRENAP
ncbi:concanavalin A-like lectin/glucanase superfamily protein [Thermomonospora umbrina]|uniref:Concanavalin A-like lectin/glucanase superfamily protein n=2 Tax=Thermomonospora umbrina TaxID=111806 RepID=A0A3D9T4K2_9ACTN|nr:concanavalin A-like lectin/glucanase superfamily protein [Thermomonospora umbrina]